jgi:hypothetical protein
LGKKLREPDIGPLIWAFRRAEADPDKPEVILRGCVMPRPRLDSYLKRKNETEDDILPPGGPIPQIPDYIQLDYTNAKSIGGHDASSGLDFSPSIRTTYSSPSTHSGSLSNKTTSLPTPVSHHGTPSVKELPGFNFAESLTQSSMSHTPAPTSGHLLRPNMLSKTAHPMENLEESSMWEEIESVESYHNVINQMLRPDSPISAASSQLTFSKILSGERQVSSREGLIRGLDQQFELSNAAAEDVNDTNNGVTLPQQFLERFFGAFMLHSQGVLEAAIEYFRSANNLLKTMIRSCHSECLTTLNVMLSVLEAHGLNRIAGDFLSIAVLFSNEHLSGNPVAETADFMVRVATRKLRIDQVDIADLQSIYGRLKDRFGPDSPSALVGLYHVAWRCAKEEQHWKESLQMFARLRFTATEVLGPYHFLTITSMTTMARVLSHVRMKHESISLMRQAIQVLKLRYVAFHPYLLEALHRLAEMLFEAHDEENAERLLREVIDQRARVIGHRNKLTQRSLTLLKKLLERRGEFVELSDLVSNLSSSLRVNDLAQNMPLAAYLPIRQANQAVAARS